MSDAPNADQLPGPHHLEKKPRTPDPAYPYTTGDIAEAANLHAQTVRRRTHASNLVSVSSGGFTFYNLTARNAIVGDPMVTAADLVEPMSERFPGRIFAPDDFDRYLKQFPGRRSERRGRGRRRRARIYSPEAEVWLAAYLPIVFLSQRGPLKGVPPQRIARAIERYFPGASLTPPAPGLDREILIKIITEDRALFAAELHLSAADLMRVIVGPKEFYDQALPGYEHLARVQLAPRTGAITLAYPLTEIEKDLRKQHRLYLDARGRTKPSNGRPKQP